VTTHEVIEAAALGSCVRAIGGRAELVGGALCAHHPALPGLELNRAIPVEQQVDLDAVSAWYAGGPHGVVAPPDQGALTDALELRGYEPVRAWMAFERTADVAEAPETDLRVEETSDGAAFDLALSEGYGMPGGLFGSLVGHEGWHCFVAWAGAEPAGCGAIYVEDGLGWLGLGATRPALRRRGAQSALLLARIEAARALGALTLYTETGAHGAEGPGPSYRNILRAGFSESYLRPNWHST
jgi:GNAT superfamily N-acetyltransferase